MRFIVHEYISELVSNDETPIFNKSSNIQLVMKIIFFMRFNYSRKKNYPNGRMSHW